MMAGEIERRSARDGLTLPACLIIMDGFGLEEPGEGNAISLANTPTLDAVFAEHPMIQIEASGEAVGLPAGQMGNSEVGHLNIGAGRVVYQELTRIDRACSDGSLEGNPVLVDVCETVRKQGSVLHFMGLLSDGGVHSSKEHLYALLRMAKSSGVPEVRVHCFLDGRDVAPSSGLGFVEELQDLLAELNTTGDTHFAIASVEGRYFAMDRDNRWDRVEKAYRSIVAAEPLSDIKPSAYVAASYDEGVTDEFVAPAAFDGRGVQTDDGIIFFNFRPDRAREITRAIVDEDFASFDRGSRVPVEFVCLTEYDPTIDAAIAFAKEFPQRVLADVVAEAGLHQYHIAETEKYAHVTFFLNGGVEEPKAGEERALIPSPSVATYDLQPEMSEPEVATTLAQAIRDDVADVYIVNFANCDMVGHTGSIPAAVKAVEAVDQGVAQVLSALQEKGGIALLTADHGNADKMISEEGGPFTAHTTAPVPLVLIDYSGQKRRFKQDAVDGALGNIAPTLLEMIGVSVPEEMDSESFLAKP